MRLFTAIHFDENTKASLYSSISTLKTLGVTGNFSLRENLHLTVVFIGETTRLAEAISALNRLRACPFTLELGGLGAFRGGTLWCGIKANAVLSDIYAQLNVNLRQNGFIIEERPFSPHLTVCREALLPTGLDIRSLSPHFPKLTVEVSQISLMKSERINGKLTYTEIHAKKL